MPSPRLAHLAARSTRTLTFTTPMSRRLSQLSGHLSAPAHRGQAPSMQMFGKAPSRSSSSSSAGTAGLAVARAASTASREGGGEDGTESKVKLLNDGPLRTILLNRPKSLNALDADMVALIAEALQSISKSDAPVVLLRGVGRALCSGGDVLAVVKAADKPETREQALDFFKAEFELDYAIATLYERTKKTFVSVMDGITMGGGVGLSVHAPIRIATERTLFAMPETGIGYFPDVGVTRCLTRLDGRIGQYLGVTGARITGEEAYLAGLATHFIPSTVLQQAIERLGTLAAGATSAQVSKLLDEYSQDPFSSDNPKGAEILANTPLLGHPRIVLDYVFGQPSAEALFSALQEVASGAENTQATGELAEVGMPALTPGIVQWAKVTMDGLQSKSPRSIKVTLQAIAEARRLDVAEAFRFDMRVATAFCDLSAGRDFYSGVMHVLSKDPATGKRYTGRAPWEPTELAGVSDEKMRDLFFGSEDRARKAGLTLSVPNLAGLPQPQTLDIEARRAHDAKLRGQGPLAWEPEHNALALPSEAEVAALVQGSHPAAGDMALEPLEVVSVLRNHKGDRPALDRKVLDFLERVEARARASK